MQIASCLVRGLIILAAGAAGLAGAGGSGSIFGTVMDPSHTAMTDVLVVARNMETGVSLRASTNSEGLFAFPGPVERLSHKCVPGRTIRLGGAGDNSFRLTRRFPKPIWKENCSRDIPQEPGTLRLERRPIGSCRPWAWRGDDHEIRQDACARNRRSRCTHRHLR
jgi:hypothetical protein